MLMLFLLVPLGAAEPVRIICIGDSITQGGKADREEWTYRLPLQDLLMSAGISFDFIGTRTGGLQGGVKWPAVQGKAFDPDHEGLYGAKTAKVAEHLQQALPKIAPPDIAFIHLGTNDQGAEDHVAAVITPLTDIINQLRARNPQVRIFLGHLNFNGGAALKIRPMVEDLATRLNTATSPVKTVPMYKGWVENPQAAGSDTFDWAHPNPQGQKKMASAWFAAMQAK
jgi:lysophospholipase L1-like esterase